MRAEPPEASPWVELERLIEGGDPRLLEAFLGELSPTEVASSSVNFDVSVWIDDPWRMMRRRSALNEAIWWALKEAEVTIVFPQVEVHFDAPVVESLRELRGAG